MYGQIIPNLYKSWISKYEIVIKIDIYIQNDGGYVFYFIS